MKQTSLYPLLGYFNNLTENDDYKQICRVLLQNMSKLGDMSIQEAAEICYTSPATISRISKRAGYGGYQGLKDAAALSCSNYFHENRILTVDQVADGNVADTYLSMLSSTIHKMGEMLNQEDINKAVSIIHESDYILSVGHGRAAEPLEMNLFFNGKYFESINLHEDNAEEYVSYYKDKNTVIILFNPGYPWMKSNCEYMLKDAGIKIILITTPQHLPNDDRLDCVLRIPSSKTSFDGIFHEIMLSILGMTYRKEYIDSWFHKTHGNQSGESAE